MAATNHRRAAGAAAGRALLGGALHDRRTCSAAISRINAIHARVANPLWQAIDISFLLVALYHGLNGLRNIVLDYSRFSARAMQAITAGLTALGIVWAWWGITAFRNL